jgi:hypothetical protein
MICYRLLPQSKSLKKNLSRKRILYHPSSKLHIPTKAPQTYNPRRITTGQTKIKDIIYKDKGYCPWLSLLPALVFSGKISKPKAIVLTQNSMFRLIYPVPVELLLGPLYTRSQG